jgi:hypothetical protein
MTSNNRITNLLSIYKRATLSVFTTSGLVFTVVGLIVLMAFNLLNFTINLQVFSTPIAIFEFNPLNIILAVISAFITMSVWWFIGTKFAPKIGNILTEKKIANILITKGDIHYFEKVERETLRISPNTIIAKFINLLLSWFAVTAFLLGFLLPLFSGAGQNEKLFSFLTSNLTDIGNYILKCLVVFVLAPILMSLTVPIPWMLLDARLKAYNSGAKINSFVGRAIQGKLNSIFAIGGVVALIMQNLSLDTIVLVIVFIFSFLAFPSMITVTLYNMLFQVQYYESFLREIPVPFGTTKVEMELKFKKNDQSGNKLEEITENSTQPESKSENDTK